MNLQTATDWLIDVTTYAANGFLVTVYFLVEQFPHLIAIACAVIIVLTFDRLAQRQAVFAPARYAGGAAHVKAKVPRTAQFFTGLTLGIWLLASGSFGPPVSLIGAILWIMAVLTLLVMPQQRFVFLWVAKAGILVYGGLVLAYRFLLWQSTHLSPSQMADIFGGKTTASAVIAQNTGSFATAGAWVLWVVLPGIYASWLAQNFIAQAAGVVNPFESARDVIIALRSRSNETGGRN